MLLNKLFHGIIKIHKIKMNQKNKIKVLILLESNNYLIT